MRVSSSPFASGSDLTSASSSTFFYEKQVLSATLNEGTTTLWKRRIEASQM
jgi:hypothetical protein